MDVGRGAVEQGGRAAAANPGGGANIPQTQLRRASRASLRSEALTRGCLASGRRGSRRGWALLCLIFFFTGISVASGQSSGTGAITGRILDPSATAVSNAAVQVVNEDTGVSRTVRSSSAGIYQASLLPPGRYSVRVELPGFQPIDRSVLVVVTETTSLDILLRLVTANSSATVTAAPELLQTQSAALGRAVDSRIITGLPLANRNFTQILALSPGVLVELPDAGELGRNNQNVSANGSRTTSNNFQFNGIDANNIAENSASGFGPEVGLAVPAPDTIAEFKVQTGLYDAAYGRSSGANVDLVSRSGANELHGDVWEFLRNDALNANDFFLNRNGSPRPILKQNQFGFTLGGPIRRGQSYFFASYQGTIQRNGESSLSLQSAFLPPLTNDRSAAALGRLFGGQTGVFGGAAVAADGSNINPAALALLNFKFPDGSYAIPSPQVVLPGGLGESTFSSPAKFREDQFTLNLDHDLAARDQLAMRFFYSRDRSNAPFSPFGANVPGWGQAETDKNSMLVLSDTHTFSPRLVNVARFGYVYFNGAQFTESPIKNADLGITSPTGLPSPPDMPFIGISGLFSVGPGSLHFLETTNLFVGEETISFLSGRHDFRVGFEVKRHQLNLDSPFSTNGFLTFLSFPDFLLGESAAQNGSGLSNVFLSDALTGSFNKAERFTDFGSFVQDDIHISPRLTLNVGLRYEFFGPPSDTRGRLSNFDPGIADPNPPAAGSFTGDVVPANFSGPIPTGVTRTNETGLWQKDFRDFAPRLGFALLLHNEPDVVVRGGYGIYYQRLSAEPVLNTVGSLPFSLTVFQAGASNASATLQVPFNPPLPPPSSFPSFAPRTPDSSIFFPAVSPLLRSPYMQEYGLNVQFTPASNLLAEVGYVGSYGSRLTGCIQFNQALLASPENPVRGLATSTLENLPERVPILGVGGGSFVCQTRFHSNYNSLQSSLTRRFSHGLSFLSSYTFSKSLDVTNGGGNPSNFDLSFITNDQNNPDNAYGPSDFDRRQRFVLTLLEQPPNLRRGPRLVRRVLSDWRFSGILVVQSGLPITPIDSTAGTVYGNAVSQVRAECTGANPASPGSVASRLDSFFNLAAFTQAPAIGDGTGFGNCGTGIVRGPGQRNLDFSIQRLFPVKERGNVEFRAEFFNLFNTPNFGLPSRDVSSPSFGVISSTASNPRIVQMALKYNF